MSLKSVKPNGFTDFMNKEILDAGIILINPYTFLHLGFGLIGFLIFKWLGVTSPLKIFYRVMLISIAWEILELGLRGILFKADSFPDAFTDLLATVVGFIIAYYIWG